jgi:hypothetical protein
MGAIAGCRVTADSIGFGAVFPYMGACGPAA